MKKVLIIGYSDVFGGIERFIIGLAERIDRTKISIDLLVYKKLSMEQEKELRKRKLDIYYVPQIGKQPLLFLKNIFLFYRTHRYDVIHINSSHAVSIMYTLPVWLCKKVKIIYHSHNMNGNTKLLHLLCKQIVKIRSDIRLACSVPAAKYMYDTSDNVEIIRNGIQISEFTYDPDKRKQMRCRIGAGKETIIIGNVGRLVEEKNPLFLIDILTELKKLNKNVRLVFVGDGPLKKDAEQYAITVGAEKGVIFTGQVNNPQDWYQIFDAFVMPSEYEGFPFAGVEAQASDLWVFLSDKITREILITPKALLLSLEKGAHYWAELIYSKVGIGTGTRKDISDEMKSAGYDFSDTVKRMEEIYSRGWKNESNI